MRQLKLFLTLVLTIGLIIVGSMRIGLVPPVGKFLDPFHGFWQNVELKRLEKVYQLDFDVLQAPVTVLIDDRLVSHIFAENDHDLYFAQGYVTAKDRLWQMEFQTHVVAGRLSEIIGQRTVEYDRFQRRIGMTYAAKNMLETVMRNPLSREIVSAYTAGVNAYIDSLSPKGYPIEYKIFDYTPEPWTPLKCMLLAKSMTWMLAGSGTDLKMTNTLAKFGIDTVEDLFPRYPQNPDPVIPKNTPWDFDPLPVGKPQKEAYPDAMNQALPFEPNPANGSNNWAVSGTKTVSGYPILANDPHLDLNLPSIWYEIQLFSPSVNVYGVTIPGAPSVLIGFNQKIAWGMTSGGDDVTDWYQIKFRDDTLNEYFHDDTWKPTTRITEEIKVRGEKKIQDTVVYTHHGPIPLYSDEETFDGNIPRLHAMRWLGHDPSNEFLTFYRLNRAQDYQDYVAALSHYSCPAQNFVFADTAGDVAIWHNGKFPLRFQRQARFINDGANPEHDWQKWVPHQHNPHIKNPDRGFVSSANQNPTNSDYPYYLGWFFPQYRGKRINQQMLEMDSIIPDDFRLLQLDNQNLQASLIIPSLLRFVDIDRLTLEETQAFKKISTWDYVNDANQIAPTVFDIWQKRLHAAIWSDEFGGNGSYRFPSSARTIQLIMDEPNAPWFDNIHTENKESLQQLVNSSFKDTVTELTKQLGEMGNQWRWGKFKGVDIAHLGRLPGFGKMGLNVGGGLGIVNAIGKTSGPSWRMVVSLEPEVKAWGVYPGGQSGNPGSSYYDNFVDAWMEGELDELLFLKSMDTTHYRIQSVIILEAGK